MSIADDDNNSAAATNEEVHLCAACQTALDAKEIANKNIYMINLCRSKSCKKGRKREKDQKVYCIWSHSSCSYRYWHSCCNFKGTITN
jgi:hypothetical protein